MRFHFHIWKNLGQHDMFSANPLSTPYRHPVRADVRKCYICGRQEARHNGWYDFEWRHIYDY